MHVKNLITPALVLDLDMFDKNLQTMNEFITGTKMALRPHYKSHKCTSIAHMQIAAGAKGICCSKLSEAEDLANAGIEDILIANQIIEPVKIAKIPYLAKCCYLTVCVDNIKNIEALESAAKIENSTIHCLVEYEVGMNRCGVSTPEDVYSLVLKIQSCPHLVFEGIQAYAGNLSHEVDYNSRKKGSENVEKRLYELKNFLNSKGIKVKEVSGTSTGTIEFRPKESIYTEIQAGSYIFMDAAYDLLNLKFENALYVLSTVMSKNANSIVCDAGIKTVSNDQKMPYFKDYPNIPVNTSEEHISIPSKDVNVDIGEKLYLIPGHCCTTVNLHNNIYFVRNDKVIDKVPIVSRGKSF